MARISGMAVDAEVVLAAREMKFRELMDVCVGSIIEFKKLCDTPVSLEIGSRVFANGEVVISKTQRFALRILDVAPGESAS